MSPITDVMVLNFCRRLRTGDNHAHLHRLRHCAYGRNRTRGLLFSRLAPAGRDHAAAEVVCAASPYFPATNSPTNANPGRELLDRGFSMILLSDRLDQVEGRQAPAAFILSA